MKYWLSLVLLSLTLIPFVYGLRLGSSTWDMLAISTQYQTSQYCLTGYRMQHATDALSPSYAKFCGDGTVFTGNLGDPELYTLAGWKYVQGADPASINFETQPLTKYLFGLSQFLFHTPLVVQWLGGLTLLALMYFIARPLLPAPWVFLPALVMSWDGLFREALTLSYVDLVETVFVTGFLLSLPSAVSKKRGYWLPMIFLGLVALSKSFSVGLVLAAVSLVWLTFLGREIILGYLRVLWVALVTYLVGYAGFFAHHPDPRDFLELHLNILRLYKSYVPEYPKFEIFRIIFAGRWREWYGTRGLIPAPGWSLAWPVSLALTAIAAATKTFRTHMAVSLHFTWVIFYLVFISLRLVFPRYLLPILPSLYLLASVALVNLFGFATVKLWQIFPWISRSGRVKQSVKSAVRFQ